MNQHIESSYTVQSLIRELRLNSHEPKGFVVILSLRLTQLVQRRCFRRSLLGAAAEITHRLLTELILGVEIRPSTKIGEGLRIFHGTGIVINDHSVLGRNVTIRNGVVIGNSRAGGGCPILGDDVDVGAAAIIIGPVVLGDQVRVGAGAVVIDSAPRGAVIVGNPARRVD